MSTANRRITIEVHVTDDVTYKRLASIELTASESLFDVDTAARAIVTAILNLLSQANEPDEPSRIDPFGKATTAELNAELDPDVDRRAVLA